MNYISYDLKTKKSYKNEHSFFLWVCIFFVLILGLGSGNDAYSQEFECMANMSPPATQAQSTDIGIYQQINKDLNDYMNKTKFTDNTIAANERIKLTINITLSSITGDLLEGTMAIKALRPVFNSSYETVIFSFNETQFRVNYTQGSTLVFSENSYTGNFTTLLNFYAYMVLGYDFDSFSLNGGQPYFEKARNQFNLAQGANEPNWNVSSSRMSKYWLITYVLDNSHKSFHNIMYSYHRDGLDKMSEDVNAGRLVILECVKELYKLWQQNPTSALVRNFIDMKSQTNNSEIVNIMKKASDQDKQQFVQMMTQIDPSNASTINTIFEP